MGSAWSSTRPDYPPSKYTVPRFPSLEWPPIDDKYRALYTIADTWRFTLLWTMILFAIFHMGSAAIALTMQLGKRPSSLKYLWTIPVIYAVVAGAEALFAGSVVGIVLGAVYISGSFVMSTWIPFIWGWINLLVLVVSSFSIQGGL